MKKLAIVIPAYKDCFFRKALDSIAAQTCKDFCLYVGNDCSPYPIDELIQEYGDKIDIVYNKFESNLGGLDLVEHWRRCIEMTQGEPYIWLFSDDDVMGKDCVKCFYDALKRYGKRDLYHFDVKVIDDVGDIIRFPRTYPNGIDNLSYYKGKIDGTYMSLVVENIFSRSVYEKTGGFQNFDLAWGSDTATWIKFSEKDGFTNVDGDFVYWRCGTQNISPNMASAVVERKIVAVTEGFNWVYRYFKQNKKRCWCANVRGFISRAALFKPYVKEKTLKECVRKFCKGHDCSLLVFVIMLAIRVKSK